MSDIFVVDVLSDTEFTAFRETLHLIDKRTLFSINYLFSMNIFKQ